MPLKSQIAKTVVGLNYARNVLIGNCINEIFDMLL